MFKMVVAGIDDVTQSYSRQGGILSGAILGEEVGFYIFV